MFEKKKKNPLKMTKKKKKKWEDLIASAVTSYTRLLPVLFLVADSLMVGPAATARQKRQEREREKGGDHRLVLKEASLGSSLPKESEN